MKRTWIAACAAGAMLTLLVPMAAFGQQRDGGPGAPPPPPPGGQGNMAQPPDDGGGRDMPPPPPGGGQGGPRGMQGGPRDPAQPRQGGGRDQGGRGPGGSWPGPGPGDRMMQTPFDNQRAYLDLVDRFTRLSHDPETAGVAAVITANELMRPKGAEAAIAYFTKILPDVKSEAVRRAIRLHLIDLYRTSGQADKALAEIDQLIKAAPEK